MISHSATVSGSRIFVVPIEPKKENDIYDGLPIYEKIKLLVLDYLYEIQVNEIDKYNITHTQRPIYRHNKDVFMHNHIKTSCKCIK